MSSKDQPAFPPGDVRKIEKHSIVVAGHRTSISLERAFWLVLRKISEARDLPIAALVLEVDANRGAANLSSALRVYLLEAASHDSAGRGTQDETCDIGLDARRL